MGKPIFIYGVTVAAVAVAGLVRWLLDPALGAGPYVMLVGGVLAAIGAIIVWFEPAPASLAPAAETMVGSGAG